MQQASFLVGRMLALADLLHREYCRHVRDGNIPPQLIGNSLMRTAMEDPQKGLARLLERMTVYQGWANTAQEGELGLAKWTLGRFGQVAAHLARVDLPTRTTDAEKAQLLLGYLAREEQSETESSPNEESE